MASTATKFDAYSLTDISPRTYLTWTKFTFPDEHGGKMAIAVSKSESRIITALYVQLITFIFGITWTILLSLFVLFLAPRVMSRTNYITLIAAWNSSGPTQVITVLGQHAWALFRGARKKDNHTEMNWRSFRLDTVIMLLAFAALGGGVAVGLNFPNLLVIGNAAPVNPESVLYPNLTAEQFDKPLSLVNMQYRSRSAVRAIASVEGYEGKIGQLVNVTISDLRKIDDDSEIRYKIHYSYTVSGLDMGLQHLSKLTLQVKGECDFEDSWFTGSDRLEEYSGDFEFYKLWPSNSSHGHEYNSTLAKSNVEVDVPATRWLVPFAKFITAADRQTSGNNLMSQETGRSYYAIIPSTANRSSFTSGKDAWYATQSQTLEGMKQTYPYQVKRGRPPLKCSEKNDWSYKHWRGHAAGLFGWNKSDGPPIEIPPAIAEILSTHLAVPVIVLLGRYNVGGALKSATRTEAADSAIDAGRLFAAEDIRRLVYAAFISTRDIFREAAIAGAASNATDLSNSDELPPIIFNASNPAFKNVLRTEDGGYMQGTGDFVMVSRDVITLSIGQLIAVPVVVAILLLILLSLHQARHNIKFTKKPGRFQQFAVYSSGLQAAQLYRLLDQALAGTATPPKWTRERDCVPLVYEDSTSELPVPELQISPDTGGIIIGHRPDSSDSSMGQDNTTAGLLKQSSYNVTQQDLYPRH